MLQRNCLGGSARLVEQEGNDIMYAVILTGGKQYKVTVGEEVFVEIGRAHV